ncbi:ADP-ribose pyrophosphatase YjhB (NUDIX family) [Bacillus iocasae]|uniref:ADP-ribose pyrophosphatase YjhB (NUDIX family) n=1 Tax=Priestia iocasae TaxID=2291674 RepID=A0ABS2QYR8_9BACI|nr:NUDIX hydrolase [Metabacillus iocasae]MBM7704616.1 ADP-ribose pyrophosphatase YjhB (NUDIX family) [Metabacillus iocasae]
MKHKRGNVWLAVAGIVKTVDNRYLVVKKKYGGLKGKWSFPAGFVNEDETIDQAVVREVYEETGIKANPLGIVGLRSGVIKGEVSDNMVLFLLEPLTENIVIQERELSHVAFMTKDELFESPDSSLLLHQIIDQTLAVLPIHNDLNPGNHFGYTSYKLFY